MGKAYANYFSKTYIVCYRKMPKSKNFTIYLLAKPFNVKQMPPKNLTISMPYLLQAQPALALYYWPGIVVLQQYADGMATV